MSDFKKTLKKIVRRLTEALQPQEKTLTPILIPVPRQQADPRRGTRS